MTDTRAAAIDGDHRGVSRELQRAGVRAALSAVASIALDGARHVLPLLLADVHPTLSGLRDSGETVPNTATAHPL